MRREMLPHQEGAQAAVEQALRLVPGIRRRVEPIMQRLTVERSLPQAYDVLTATQAVGIMRAAEDACREAGLSAQLFPCTSTGWQSAARRWGVSIHSHTAN